MIVDVCEGNMNVTNVFTLNDTAAYLWRSVGREEFDVERLADLLTAEYECTREEAIRDAEELVGEWTKYGLLAD